MNIKSNLQGSLSDQKSRVFLFLMVGVILVITVFYYVTFSSSGQQVSNKPNVRTRLSNPAAGITSIPGAGTTTAKYKELTKKNEQKELEKAIKQAKGGEPTAIISSLDFSDVPDFNDKPKDDYDAKLQQRFDVQQTSQNQRNRKRDMEEARKKIEERNKRMLKLLARQAKVLAAEWQINPLAAEARDEKDIPELTSPMAIYLREKAKQQVETPQKPSIYYKAGDILFGIIITAVNSDQPSGPVLARILSGPLSNSKIVGRINKESIPDKGTNPRVSQSLVLEFNTINIPGSKNSLPVQAVAIDPATARTSLASAVDNHYILRYGAFFASEFLAGLGKAISTQTATTVVTGNGTADIGRTREFSTKDEAKIAIGSTAESLGEAFNFLERPPTIEVAAGTAVGILLLEDLVISSDSADTVSLIGNNPVAPPNVSDPTRKANSNTNLNIAGK